MEPIDLKPGYSTQDIPGRCVKCLAEQKLRSCLFELLENGCENKELRERFEMLAAFLKSPESQELRDEAERHLAEGKQVTVNISFELEKPRYELKVE
ncbi:MAG: hypothetical protein IBX68_01195 [Dehalococcoidia bacterium]|nr:hypothetical protein [Dehalococcoidia bacterium]